MAAPLHTNSNFCDHLFSILKKQPIGKQSSTESIVTIFNETLLVWNNFKCTFHVCSLASSPSIEDSRSQIQTLVFSNPPLFSVTSIVVNSNESHVALIGSKGIAIMELPSQYGTGSLFQGGKDRILCKSMLVDERYFSSHRKQAVLKVLWHPGSPNSSHICVLTSDNSIRIYNISKLDCPYQTLALATEHTSRFSSALGESFVSMTFGQSLATAAEHHSIWPLYLLTEMGCVYMVHSKLWSNSPMVVEGPLKMCPTAEDNYGTDSCDILYLASVPEALVISTTSGSLIHAVLLSGEEDVEEDDTMNIVDGLPSLYVYDRAMIELRLTVASGNSFYDRGDDEELNTTLLLVKDPVLTDRYYCMHSAGVHSIQLPWLHNFQQYSTQGAMTGEGGFSMIDEQSATSCQHVVCTQPLVESKPSPIRGLAVITEDVQFTSLICVLSDFTCFKHPIRNGPVSELPVLLSSLSSPASQRHESRRSFDTHIAELLKKDATNPLIKTGSEQSLTAQQSYQLLARATQVFREQYVDKLLSARRELDRRVSSLQMLKEQQLEDLEVLQKQKLDLTDAARDLAERYEDVCEQNELISDRIEDVVSKIHSSISELSDGERSLSQLLVKRERDVKELQSQLEQIKNKYKYQRESFNKKSSDMPSLTEPQLKRVNTILTDESKQISELVGQVQDIMAVTE